VQRVTALTSSAAAQVKAVAMERCYSCGPTERARPYDYGHFTLYCCDGDCLARLLHKLALPIVDTEGRMLPLSGGKFPKMKAGGGKGAKGGRSKGGRSRSRSRSRSKGRSRSRSKGRKSKKGRKKKKSKDDSGDSGDDGQSSDDSYDDDYDEQRGRRRRGHSITIRTSRPYGGAVTDRPHSASDDASYSSESSSDGDSYGYSGASRSETSSSSSSSY
jgi:hypothetical protein